MTAAIRQLNDALRTRHAGGRVMVTQGVAALGPAFVTAALGAVAAFDSFSADNDPYGEHDFGSLTVASERLFFKIDYYDRSLTGGSPDPADPTVTCRVLTIMLVSEH